MKRKPPPQDTPEEFPPGYDEVSIPIADPLDEPAANLGDDGRHHFCVIPADLKQDDYCGGCGDPWPCDQATHLIVVQNQPE